MIGCPAQAVSKESKRSAPHKRRHPDEAEDSGSDTDAMPRPEDDEEIDEDSAFTAEDFAKYGDVGGSGKVTVSSEANWVWVWVEVVPESFFLRVFLHAMCGWMGFDV